VLFFTRLNILSLTLKIKIVMFAMNLYVVNTILLLDPIYFIDPEDGPLGPKHVALN
jgi:hypothetical protein